MNPKLIFTILCAALCLNLQAQHVTFGIYGGPGFNILPSSLKDMSNPAKSTLTPEYGAKLLIDLKRFQFGIGYNKWTLKYVQDPMFIQYKGHVYSVTEEYTTTLKFKMYQVLANYKFSSNPSYLYSGVKISYFEIQDDLIEGRDAFLYGFNHATKSQHGITFGMPIGYNLHLTKGLNVQFESGFNFVPLPLRIIAAEPYYGLIKASMRNSSGNIVHIPLTFGINYSF